jgi:hypothetical protein
MLKRWDIFCKIVDNFGDIGVCWRLARQLQLEHGLQVRLWIDDLAAAQKIIPSLNVDEKSQICENITILKWNAEADFSQATEVVIEAFACELSPSYLAAMSRQQSKWVNLEYLSAETWVDDFHAKPSPQNLLNRNQGLTRYFYFPGFTEAAGGLIREAGLAEQLQTLINPRPQAGEGARQRERGAALIDFVAPLSNLSGGTTKHLTRLTNNISQVIANPASGREASVVDSSEHNLKISLFCYPHAPVKALLGAFSESTFSINCYVPASSILPQIADFFGAETIAVGDYFTRENLHVHILPFLSQADYDQLLRDCDLNFVRGEDSWVRAIWAGKPFIWQPYLQDENTHILKLKAFIDLYYKDYEQREMLWEAHGYWLAEHANKMSVKNDFKAHIFALINNLENWQIFTQKKAQHLAQQTDLARKLVVFCNKL